MDFDGVVGDGVHGVHVGGQLLNIHHHRVGGGPCVGLGVGGHNGDGVAELEDLLIAQHRTVPAVALVVQGQHDQAVDPVFAAGGHNILGGEDAEHTGHLLRGGGVDAFDQGVADLGLNQSQTQGVGGHLQRIIGAEVPGSGDLLGGGGTDVAGAHDGVAGGLEYQIFLGDLAPDNPGGVHHRIDQGFIAGAAAQVPVLLEPVPDLFPGGGGIVVQQHLGGHDEAGGAEAALGTAVGHPGHLQRVHIGNGADALNGGDLGAVFQAAHFGDAGAGDLAVYNHVAGAAVAFAAADLTSGEQQTLPEHRCQGFVVLHQQGAVYAVDDQVFLNHCHFLLFRLEAVNGLPSGCRRGRRPAPCR